MDEPLRRLFFAVWPDEPSREALQARMAPLIGDLPGRAVAAANWHITVAFLGEIDGNTQACVEVAAAAAAARAQPFVLTLDEFGYWPRPQVVWVGARQCPSSLQTMVVALRQGLQGCGLPMDDRPFAAHLTLRRKVARRPRLPVVAEPFIWRVTSLSLVQSQLRPAGASYQVVGSWLLGPC
jgi:2'-5' RNA ligase